FLGTEQLEVTLPLSTSGRTMPVASISFDPANPGKMLLAERGMDSTVAAREIFTFAHQARVLEYDRTGNLWVSSANVFNVGTITPQTNSSGGVTYSCPAAGGPASVVGTGDALHFGNPDIIYGLQIFPSTGGTIANSYLVDLDGA